METMHAAGRRTLPPVPRTRPEKSLDAPDGTVAEQPESDAPTERFVVDLSTGEQHRVDATLTDAPAADAGPAPDADNDDAAPGPAAEDGARQDASERAAAELDAAQQFVARLRASAADFAAAAGAESAVVREAVPPARHRRARCRLVLRYADESQVDVTFLGQAGLPGSPSRHGFDRQIRRWLKAGQRREDAWLVSDPDAPDGLAVDLSAWIAAA